MTWRREGAELLSGLSSTFRFLALRSFVILPERFRFLGESLILRNDLDAFDFGVGDHFAVVLCPSCLSLVAEIMGHRNELMLGNPVLCPIQQLIVQ